MSFLSENQKRENIIEKDIEELAKEVKKRISNAETGKEKKLKIVKEAIKDIYSGGEKEKKEGSEKSEVGVVSEDFMPEYAKSAPDKIKTEIESLLDIAFSKGILEANKLAEKKGAFVMDAFHDALAGRLYDKLKEKGGI